MTVRRDGHTVVLTPATVIPSSPTRRAASGRARASSCSRTSAASSAASTSRWVRRRPHAAASTSICSSGCLGRGYTVLYEPNAIIWREHPAHAGAPPAPDLSLRHRPRRDHQQAADRRPGTPGLAAGDARRGAPLARSRTSDSTATRPPATRFASRWLMRLGMLLGPFAYLWSAFLARARRLRRGQPFEPDRGSDRATAGRGRGDDQRRLVRRLPGGQDSVLLALDRRAGGGRRRFEARPRCRHRASRFRPQPSTARRASARSFRLAMPSTGSSRACPRSARTRPAEIILVDGGSTDRTVELARPWVDKVIDDGGPVSRRHG